MGLAGFYLIRDEVEAALGLPAGEFEVPLAIQDRTFNADGSLSYPVEWDEHFFGDKVLVNGKVWPYLAVKQGKYRFRLLNGSNSRTYTLAFSSGDTFHQIGTDGGSLRAPVPLTELTIMPGERADVVVDFAGHAGGTEILLTNSASAPYPGPAGVGVIPNVMKFVVTNQPGHTASLPATLRDFETLYETNAVQHREFVLRKGDDDCSEFKWLINDLGWHDITEYPVLDTTEVWNFINRSGVAHPMHMHLVLFQVLDRQAFEMVGDEIVPVGPRIAPLANEMGPKDTVRVNPFEMTRVIARFETFTGKYPYHCHILEHEDHEMMRQFQVLAPPEFTSVQWTGEGLSLAFMTLSNRLHQIERCDDLAAQNWNAWLDPIPGTGSETTVIDSSATNSVQGFYRIRLVP
jgi:spore coat protein A, manganese oxidase